MNFQPFNLLETDEEVLIDVSKVQVIIPSAADATEKFVTLHFSKADFLSVKGDYEIFRNALYKSNK